MQLNDLRVKQAHIESSLGMMNNNVQGQSTRRDRFRHKSMDMNSFSTFMHPRNSVGSSTTFDQVGELLGLAGVATYEELTTLVKRAPKERQVTIVTLTTYSFYKN